jgi:AcrR family transcriptional regulator
MTTAMTRKQREILEREELILHTARRMLLEKGYLGLTMDRIADEIEYSKGTVYHHFRSKEDLIVALAEQSHKQRTSLFQRAAAFPGLSRERCLAVGVAQTLLVTLYPDTVQAEIIIKLASVQEKAAAERLTAIYTCQSRCFEVVAGVIRDATVRGDLDLGALNLTPEDVAFGLWSMAEGAFMLEASAIRLPDLGIRNSQEALWNNYQALLDGYGWKPLAAEHDYHGTQRRVLEEVFPEEGRRAGLF